MAHSPCMKYIGVLGMVALLLGATPKNDAPIADAAMLGDVQAVQELLRQGADVNASQGDGMTALHWAAEKGEAGLAQMLIAAGANPRAVTRIGAYTPLHIASRMGHASVIKALLAAGGDPNAVTTTGGTTPLHFAAASGEAEAVSTLLDHGAAVNARELERGQTPLMFAAANNHVAAIKVLVSRGADLETSTKVVNLPAREAADRAANRRRNQVLATFRAGADANWRPAPTEVQIAVRAARQVQIEQEHAALVAADEGADDEGVAENSFVGYSGLVGAEGGMRALLYAAREGHVEAVLALLEAGADINRVSAGDRTSPLLMAALNGHFDLVLMLLERGADPNLASDAGTTPLYGVLNLQWAPKARYPQPVAHLSQQATYLEVMEELLKAGANPNVRLNKHLWYMSYTFDLLDIDSKGATPFWRAAYATDIEAMRLLVAYGADPAIPTMKTDKQRYVGDYLGDDGSDPSGLPPVPDGGPGVWPIHAASGVGFGDGYAANAHRGVPGGWLPAVKYLVEELGADVNARDHNGYNAIHHAAARGDNEVIKYLVGKGADVMAVSRRGQTTVDMANGPVQRIQPFPETIRLLESLGARNNNRCISC